jgi:hypothetical protein
VEPIPIPEASALNYAPYVNSRLSRPDATRFTRIDLAPLIEKGWADL